MGLSVRQCRTDTLEVRRSGAKCLGMDTPHIDSLHLICPHCGQINRVARQHLAHAPDCGRCHRALFDGHPLALDEAGFDRHISKGDLPVLVDFWAPWCGPCRMMAPAYEQAAQQLEPQLRVAKVDTEAVPALAARHQIRSIPTLALFWRGRELARQAGAMGAGDIVRWATTHARGAGWPGT